MSHRRPASGCGDTGRVEGTERRRRRSARGTAEGLSETPPARASLQEDGEGPARPGATVVPAPRPSLTHLEFSSRNGAICTPQRHSGREPPSSELINSQPPHLEDHAPGRETEPGSGPRRRLYRLPHSHARGPALPRARRGAQHPSSSCPTPAPRFPAHSPGTRLPRPPPRALCPLLAAWARPPPPPTPRLVPPPAPPPGPGPLLPVSPHPC